MFGKTSGASPDTGKIPQRLCYSVEEVAQLLGGVTDRYVGMLMSAGDLPSIKLGRRRMVEHEALIAFVAGLREDAATATAAALDDVA